MVTMNRLYLLFISVISLSKPTYFMVKTKDKFVKVDHDREFFNKITPYSSSKGKKIFGQSRAEYF